MSSQSTRLKIHFHKGSQIPDKYLSPKRIAPNGQEIPWPDTPETIAWLLEYANNARQAEIDAKEEAKRE